MKQIEEMKKDLIDIFDEEYYRRNLITPQNTAEKLVEKGYRKPSEVAREIFELVECAFSPALVYEGHTVKAYIAELKKKYTESERNNGKV